MMIDEEHGREDRNSSGLSVILCKRYGINGPFPSTILLQAVDGVNNCTNFTQVLVVVTDANDNWPQFQTAEKVHLEVAEDQPIHEPFFVLQARDRDTGQVPIQRHQSTQKQGLPL
jgi:hypothetical protein